MSHPTFPISHLLIFFFEFRPPTHFSHMSQPTFLISLTFYSRSGEIAARAAAPAAALPPPISSRRLGAARRAAVRRVRRLLGHVRQPARRRGVAAADCRRRRGTLSRDGRADRRGEFRPPTHFSQMSHLTFSHISPFILVFLSFAHRTHFSQMSHPTFPISHLLFLCFDLRPSLILRAMSTTRGMMRLTRTTTPSRRARTPRSPSCAMLRRSRASATRRRRCVRCARAASRAWRL